MPCGDTLERRKGQQGDSEKGKGPYLACASLFFSPPGPTSENLGRRTGASLEDQDRRRAECEARPPPSASIARSTSTCFGLVTSSLASACQLPPPGAHEDPPDPIRHDRIHTPFASTTFTPCSANGDKGLGGTLPVECPFRLSVGIHPRARSSFTPQAARQLPPAGFRRSPSASVAIQHPPASASGRPQASEGQLRQLQGTNLHRLPLGPSPDLNGLQATGICRLQAANSPPTQQVPPLSLGNLPFGSAAPSSPCPVPAPKGGEAQGAILVGPLRRSSSGYNLSCHSRAVSPSGQGTALELHVSLS